ncbi:MAG: hypothetical protein DRN18_00105 [Thermoplasmata archaeon]|nr:MAG: hypothetical protein DRN18_00105 [Thermoplasmata archaeon]
MMTGYGDMKLGLMCLNCGRIAPTLDIYWSFVFDYKNNEPIIVCPECLHINCIERITYMVAEVSR